MRTNDSKIGPVRKAILKFLTKLQEKSIANHTGFYELVTKLHFRIYSGISLDKAVISDNIDAVDMFAKAAHRHGNMVVCLCYPELTTKTKKKFRRLAAEAFTKDYLLDKEV